MLPRLLANLGWRVPARKKKMLNKNKTTIRMAAKSVVLAITLAGLSACETKGELRPNFESAQAGVKQGFRSLGAAVGEGVGSLRQGLKRPNSTRSSASTVEIAVTSWQYPV